MRNNMNTKKALQAVVLDDDFSQAEGMAANLRRLGFQAKAVNRWQDAKSELEQMQRVDWLVIDNALKAEKSGIQFTGEFLQEGKATVWHILVVTGSASALTASDTALAKKWGMRVEHKPVDLARLTKEEFPALNQLTSVSQGGEPLARWKRFMAWAEQHPGLGQWVGVALVVLSISVTLLLTMFGRSGSVTPIGPPAKPTNLTARLAINPVPLAALAILADKSGAWTKAGLRVEIISFPTGKAALDAVIGGGADFATAAETPIMRAGLAGYPLAVLATIATSPDDCQVSYRRDHGISTPADLKGKKVATAIGTSAEYFMDAFLRHHGLKREELTVVSMRPPEMVNALANGDISAFFIWEPYPLKARQILKEKAGVFKTNGIYRETFQIVTRQDYAKQNEEKSKHLLQGLLAAEHLARTVPQDAANKVAEFTQLAPQEVSEIWKNFNFTVMLDAEFVELLEKQAAWARAIEPNLSMNVNFQSLLWPEPLRQVAPDRVSVKP